MSILTISMVLAMVLWALGFVLSGLFFAERLVWRPPSGDASRRIPLVRKVAAILLVVIGGTLVATTVVTAVLVGERFGRLAHLEGTVSQLELKLNQLEALLHKEASDLRQRLPGSQ